LYIASFTSATFDVEHVPSYSNELLLLSAKHFKKTASITVTALLNFFFHEFIKRHSSFKELQKAISKQQIYLLPKVSFFSASQEMTYGQKQTGC